MDEAVGDHRYAVQIAGLHLVTPDIFEAEPLRIDEERRFLIDALNVAYWCGSPPSLRLPMTLMTELLLRRHAVQLVFDASARYRLKDEVDLYEQLMLHPTHCIEVPSGRSADEALLKQARASGACIVSRDHYGDHRRRFRKLIDDPSRLLSGWVRDNHLQLLALSLDVALPSSAQEAWAQLQTLLQTRLATQRRY